MDPWVATRSQARTFRIQQERWKVVAERSFRNELAKAFNAAGREAADAIRHGLDPLSGPLLSGGGHEEAVDAILTKHITRVGKAWGGLVINKAPEKYLRGLEVKAVDAAFEAWLAEFLRSYRAGKITAISETTRARIAAVVAGSFTSNVTASITINEILRVFRRASRLRAETIARTETSAIANAATNHAANTLGIEVDREWVAASDSRTRPSHQEVNGTVHKEGEPFTVGGYSLRWPGDPDGPAHEVINCRCAIALRNV